MTAHVVRAPKPPLRIWFHTQKLKLYALIDSRIVRPFQVFMYLCFAISGAYVVLHPDEPELINTVAGQTYTVCWGWLMLVSAMVTMFGFLPSFNKTVRRKNLATHAKTGKIILQLVGDIGMFCGLLVYVYANYAIAFWRITILGFTETTGLTLCVLLLIVGDVRALCQSQWFGWGRNG